MKVLCIEEGFSNNLTTGKWYDVIRKTIDDGHRIEYGLINDMGFFSLYSFRYFQTMDEYRASQIDKILE